MADERQIALRHLKHALIYLQSRNGPAASVLEQVYNLVRKTYDARREGHRNHSKCCKKYYAK